MMKWMLAAVIVFSGCSSPFFGSDPSSGTIQDRNQYEIVQEEYEMRDVLSRFKPGVILTGKNGIDDTVEKSDLRFFLSGLRSRFTGRIEKKENITRSVIFIENQGFSGRVRLYAGDFMPDLALGAIFAGYRFSYPFSSGYPLRRERSITRHTSFYGTSIRGAALRAGTSGSSLLLFAGRAGKWNDKEFKSESRNISGARIEADSGRYRAGMTLCSDNRHLLAGFDHTVEDRNCLISGELLRSGEGKTGLLWGMRKKTGACRVGFLFFRLPSGMRNRFGDIPGGIGDQDSDKRGISVVGSFSRPRFGRFRASFEKRRDDNGKETVITCSSRFEYSARLHSGRWRLSYSRRDGTETGYTLFPPGKADSRLEKEKLDLLISARPYKIFTLRIQAGCIWSEEYHGYILLNSLSFGGSRSLFRTTIFSGIYRSVRGRPAFYSYEPALIGGYPWKYLSDNGIRAGIKCRLKIGRSSVNLKFADGTQDSWEIDFQLLFDL
ncbi:MAG: hypothetical protein JW746_09445 [Candidatus Krumholzibacteriota bacterium]|nr:hypothetical protein [Candidatus Krumholzibacteriota bacterium]